MTRMTTDRLSLRFEAVKTRGRTSLSFGNRGFIAAEGHREALPICGILKGLDFQIGL
jgi:hypothetical protein